MSEPRENDSLLKTSSPQDANVGNESVSSNSQSFRVASCTILILLVLVFIYHALIITQVVSYEKVWGGRLANLQQMQHFESVSIVVNCIILAIALLRQLYPNKNIVLAISCWIICGIYAINTLGNFLATTRFERFVFTPMTLVLSVCFARLALGVKEE